MNIKQSLATIGQQLASAGIDNPNLEAELLLAKSLKKDREFLLSYPELALNSAQKRTLAKLAKRRLAREPLAYILGHQQFYNIDLAVNKKVLIPRPETELIVEMVLAAKPSEGATIIDVGTGSGAMIISLAKNLTTKCRLIASDISSAALKLAKSNAENNNQADKIEFIKSDLLKKLLKNKYWTKGQEVWLVTNLPYLGTDWQGELSPEQIVELNYEPSLALFAGADGFDLYRRLAQELKVLIKKFDLKVKLYAEIAPNQANLFSHTFAELGTVSLERDLTGRVRVGIMK